ncbi:MAG: DUF6069 family protein [Nocardioidaceae bacterium]
MTSMNDQEVGIDRGVAAGDVHLPSAGIAVTGGLATVAAVVATSVVAAVAKAVGVDFELPDGGASMPWTGVALMTGIFSVVGIVIAAAFRRWSAHPAKRFITTTVTLTAISLLPPFLVDANAPTVTALLLIHLVAAAVMIPALTRALER